MEEHRSPKPTVAGSSPVYPAIGKSSNGKTVVFGTTNKGSIPFFPATLQRASKMSDRAIFKIILGLIRDGEIFDVGYCFDDDYHTVQFCIGAVVCRVNLGPAQTISVSYGGNVHWGVKQNKICDALHELIMLSDGPIGQVRVPPPVWQEYYWYMDKDFKWHAKICPLSLKSSLTTLFDPFSYPPLTNVGDKKATNNYFTPSYDVEAHRITGELMVTVLAAASKDTHVDRSGFDSYRRDPRY